MSLSQAGDVAIIGAGIAGLTCAKKLVDNGINVTLFEKSRGVGGRMSTRRTPDQERFDHGAQYFTARDERFKAVVDTWLRADVVAPWNGRFVKLSDGEISVEDRNTTRYVGVPGMSSVCRHMATGLQIYLNTKVLPPERRGTRWHLRCQDQIDRGEFDCVISSAPASQTAGLLCAASELQHEADSVIMHGCWAAMLSFDRPLKLGFEGAFIEKSPLAWIACNSSKPRRDHGSETWVLHGAPDWSEEHMGDSPEHTLDKLTTAFFKATGQEHVRPNFSTCHRWRYAIPASPLDTPYLFEPALRLGACGDWCGGPRVEGAFLSGMAMADRIMG